MRAKKLLSVFMLIFIVLALPLAFAQEDDEDEDDIELFGLEAEELLALISGNLAAALAVLTFLAYFRSKRTKLLYVGTAFVLFSLKLFMEASELFIDEIPFLDPFGAILDFVILLLFLGDSRLRQQHIYRSHCE